MGILKKLILQYQILSPKDLTAAGIIFKNLSSSLYSIAGLSAFREQYDIMIVAIILGGISSTLMDLSNSKKEEKVDA